jgi:hypothetical protein
MLKRWFVSSALALVVGSSALAQEKDMTALPAHDLRWEQPSGPVRVGDALTMKAIGFNRDTKSFAIKSSADPVEQGFYVSNQAQDGVPEGEFWFKVTPLRPGKLALPSLEIVDSGGQGVARTNPFEVEVTSAIRKDDPRPDTPEGLRGPARLAFPLWVLAVLSVLVALLLSGALWFAWRKIKQWRDRPRMKLPEVPKTDDEIALIALAELEARKYLDKGEHKKHYFQLSDILKIYLGARYEFDAPESTAREIIMHLEGASSLSPQMLDRLQSTFDLLDRVKYTDHVPEAGEGERLLTEVRRLVTTTRKPKTVVLNSGPAGPTGGKAVTGAT